ncbi:MAG: TIGR03663 family protein [Archaeoglobaceae archaeon]
MTLEIKKERIIVISTLLLSLVIRIHVLYNPLLFFDESAHAAIVVTVPEGYKYDPAFHGPLHYYTVAPVLKAFGESEFTLRIVPAILGVLFVASIFLYKRYLGNKAYIAALFIAISPLIVNYSRFYREDVYVLLFTSLGLYFFLRYLEFEKSWKEVKFDKATLHFVLFAIFMALFATVKETFYVFAFFMVLYGVLVIKKLRISDLLIASMVFFAIYLTLFSVFWRDNILSFESFPMVKAVSYWYGQHVEQRIRGPPYYYLLLLLLYNAPALVLALFAIYNFCRGKERDEFTRLFIYLFFANLAFFSYMQEKLPWLVVHIEFPMLLLASKVVGRRGLVITALFMLYGCIAINFINPINYAEPGLYLPTNYEVRDLALKLSGNETVYFLMNSGEAWPAVWYVKHYTGKYPYILENCVKVSADVIVANESCAFELGPYGEKIVVRCYNLWTEEKTWLDPGIVQKLPSFLLFRTPLSDTTTCLNYVVFRE